MNVNQAGTIGGSAGDGQPDVVIVNGTNGDDTIEILGAGTSASVVGLSAQVNITNAEGANDSLVINALGGDDAVTATTLPAGVIKLTIDGGAGDDTLLALQGADVFLGGDGNDFVFGDNGNDVAFLGAGDDVFQWDPATATTPSRARTAPTRCCSSARTPARTSTSWPTAGGSCSSATWPT